MRRAEAQEFCDNACQFVEGDEVITIERDGEPFGYYIPARVVSEPVRKERAFERLGEVVQQILDRTGMTEDELARLFDLSVPLDELPPPRPQVPAAAARASGR
jgi:hypothetical protein